MIRFAVVDDDPSVRACLLDYIRRLGADMRSAFDVQTYCDGEQFLSHDPAGADIIFMDIEMPLLSGLQTAAELRHVNPHGFLIFVTSFEKYAVRGYEVGAYRYLVKPVSYEDFLSSVRAPVSLIEEKTRQVFSARTTNGFVQVPYGELFYLENAGNHHVIMHTQKGDHVLYSGLNAVEASLNPAVFIRCHTSFLVNLQHIARVSGLDIEMDNGDRLPVSKHRKSAFTAAFLSYIQGVYT